MPWKPDEHTDQTWMRIDAVILTILKNTLYLERKRSEGLKEIVMKKFNCSKRTANYYIAEARKEVLKIGQIEKEKAFERAMQDREYLFQLAKEQDDVGKALDVIKDRDRLRGFYVDNVKHSGEISIKDINLNSLTDDQLTKLKAYLKNKVPLKDALLHIGVIIT